jgi:glutathione S-transferase
MFPGSNAAAAASLMLEHKSVTYDQVWLPPGLHAFIMLGLGFQSMGIPAADFDGRRVQGSRWIARALDELVPEPALFPADPELRRKVEDAERWGEHFQDAMRRLFYCSARRDRSVFTTMMKAGRGRGMHLALRLGAPLMVRLAAGAHHASDSAGREDLELLPERLSQVDAWIEEGLLNSEELNAADFQIAPNVAGLLRSADLWPYVEGRPAAELARRVVPAGVGARVRIVPPEWLGAEQEPFGRKTSPSGAAPAGR